MEDNRCRVLGGEGRILYMMLPLFAAAAVGSGVLAYAGSISGALAFLGGRDFFVEPAAVDVGVGRDGEYAVVQIRLQNLAWRPLEVLGIVPDCSCVRVVESPQYIAPRSVGVVKLRVAFTGRPGKFQQAVNVYCDSPGQFRVVVLVRGAVGT